MATKVKETPVIEPVVVSVPAPSPGFLPRLRYRRVECDWIEPEEGSSPFWADVVCSLTPAQIEAIPAGPDAWIPDICKAIAPYVRAWNVMALNVVTGQVEDVPPPAEGGAEAFGMVEPLIVIFLANRIRRMYLGDPIERPKESSKPASTDVTPSVAD